jgi:quinoprotein glucose dehydrogenase
MPRQSEQTSLVAKVYVTSLALFVGVIGVVIDIGGVWLILLGGSWYDALAGLGMIGFAALLWQRSMAGVWVYATLFGATVLWALYERGLNGWALLPRLGGPAVLMILILLAIPVLRRVPVARRSDQALLAAGVGL